MAKKAEKTEEQVAPVEIIETAIATYENLDASIFQKDGLVAPILEALKSNTMAIVYDPNDKKDRTSANGISRKLGGFKTRVDDLGAQHVKDAKEAISKIDKRRKEWKDGIADIQNEFLKPAKEWQEKEDARVEAIQGQIKEIEELGSITDHHGRPIELTGLKSAQSTLNGLSLDEDSYSEFLTEAQAQWAKSSQCVGNQIALLEQAEADRLEQERLAKEKADKEREEREKRIADEAAQKAREETLAETKVSAKVDTAAIEEPKEKPAAVDDDSQLLKPGGDYEISVTNKIEPKPVNQRNQAIVNNEILKDLCEHSAISREQAKGIVIAMTKGLVRNVVIDYSGD